MRLHLLFPTVKTAALHLVPIKSYSKNTHPPSFLKWAICPTTYIYTTGREKSMYVYGNVHWKVPSDLGNIPTWNVGHV